MIYFSGQWSSTYYLIRAGHTNHKKLVLTLIFLFASINSLSQLSFCLLSFLCFLHSYFWNLKSLFSAILSSLKYFPNIFPYPVRWFSSGGHFGSITPLSTLTPSETRGTSSQLRKMIARTFLQSIRYNKKLTSSRLATNTKHFWDSSLYCCLHLIIYFFSS